MCLEFKVKFVVKNWDSVSETLIEKIKNLSFFIGLTIFCLSK